MILQHKAKDRKSKYGVREIFSVRLPEYARFYAIPYAMSKKGLQKYKNQSRVHQWAIQKVTAFEKREYCNIITVFIGEPTSIAAIQKGHFIDASDGSSGILSQTGCGVIDSAIVFQLLADGASVDQIENLLSKQSGFKALAGRPFKLNDILGRRDIKAKFAREVFCYQILKHIGASIANLGGADLILFIGEGQKEVEKVIFDLMRQLKFLGMKKRLKVARGEVSLLTTDDSLVKACFIKYAEPKTSRILEKN